MACIDPSCHSDMLRNNPPTPAPSLLDILDNGLEQWLPTVGSGSHLGLPNMHMASQEIANISYRYINLATCLFKAHRHPVYEWTNYWFIVTSKVLLISCVVEQCVYVQRHIDITGRCSLSTKDLYGSRWTKVVEWGWTANTSGKRTWVGQKLDDSWGGKAWRIIYRQIYFYLD